MKSIYEKYADLLVDYCLELRKGDKLFISTSMLAEPLLREIYRKAIGKGALVEVSMDFAEKNRIYMEQADKDTLDMISPVRKLIFETFDAYLYIRAPFNLREDQSISTEKQQYRRQATKEINKLYFDRTADRSMRRNLCQFPTQSAAQNAGMSLEEYEKFVFTACKLYDDNPTDGWIKVRKDQQRIVDHLNTCEKIQYKSDRMDISFSTRGRTWINSDGQTNMPSGEVFTAPVDNSVNGTVGFTFPAIYMGREVEDVLLYVKDGWIEKWEAKKGKEFLDEIFKIEGTRRFGEAAIGTNYNIQKLTRNILFDEKIGGSIHMAIGQAYKQCGGTNQSTVHWDMISDMKLGGEIYANDELIYEDGKFLI
jgi:aminopeptidase